MFLFCLFPIDLSLYVVSEIKIKTKFKQFDIKYKNQHTEFFYTIIKYIVIDICIYTHNSIKNGCTDIKRLKQMYLWFVHAYTTEIMCAVNRIIETMLLY